MVIDKCIFNGLTQREIEEGIKIMLFLVPRNRIYIPFKDLPYQRYIPVLTFYIRFEMMPECVLNMFDGIHTNRIDFGLFNPFGDIIDEIINNIGFAVVQIRQAT